MAYQIFTDAAADLTAEMLEGLPPVTIIPMEFTIGGQTHACGLADEPNIIAFYNLQRNGSMATTSQINPTVYLEAFEACLSIGQDVLYLCFSSGLSATFDVATLCANTLQKKYPSRKIRCIDTLCASVGQGFLVLEAARKQAEGMDFDTLCDWIRQHQTRVCHCFTIDTFTHLRHGGRISAAAASIGSTLNLKPLLRVDTKGRLEVTARPRGHKQAMKLQLRQLTNNLAMPEHPLIVIGHGDCMDRAQALSLQVRQCYPDADIFIAPIGPIIGAHTGPGMLALIYWGYKR